MFGVMLARVVGLVELDYARSFLAHLLREFRSRPLIAKNF